MSKLLVVGDIFIDRYTYGSVDRLAPDFLGMVFDQKEVNDYLGGAGFLAEILAKILPSDVEIHLTGSLSQKDTSLLSPSIKFDSVGNLSMIKNRIVACGYDQPDKPWNKQKIIRIDEIKKFDINLNTTISNYDIVVVSDYAKGTIENLTFGSNQKVIIDTKDPNINKYSKCDVLKINEFELKMFKNDLENIPMTIVTHGAKPIVIYEHGIKVTEIDTFDVPQKKNSNKSYDPSGAGDAFLAGYVYGQIRNQDYITSCKMGNILASLKVSQFGTSPDFAKAFHKELKNAYSQQYYYIK